MSDLTVKEVVDSLVNYVHSEKMRGFDTAYYMIVPTHAFAATEIGKLLIKEYKKRRKESGEV